MLNEIQTGSVSLQVLGEEAFIIRKDGKRLKIPDAKENREAIERLQKAKDYNGIGEYEKNKPKIEEGDTISIGKDTFATINVSYDLGKDKPFDDPQHRASISITLFPNSELVVAGYERWNREDKGAEKRFVGEIVKSFKITKGMFNCSYANCEEPLITPVADVVFKKSGGNGIFDLQDGNLYCQPNKSENLLLGPNSKGEVLFTSKPSGKTYTAKSDFQEEIIVTSDSIYRLPFLKIDQVFSLENNLGAISVPAMIAKEMIPESAYDTLNFSTTADTMMQGMDKLSVFEKMAPEDLERLTKMNGQELSPEQLEQIKSFPEMLNKMKKEGLVEKMKEAGAQVKAFGEGLGEEGMQRMANLRKKGERMSGEYYDKMKDKLLSLSRSRRNYAPLNSEYKVA